MYAGLERAKKVFQKDIMLDIVTDGYVIRKFWMYGYNVRHFL